MVSSSDQNKSQNCLLSLLSESDIKKKERKKKQLRGDCGVGGMRIEEKVIQGTFRTEGVLLAVHRPETGSSSSFTISYTKRGRGCTK